MFAHVTIETGREPGAIVVPREAVQHDAQGAYVMVVNRSDLAHRRRVFLGQSAVSVLQITSGLYPGEQVITLTPRPLKDGERVQVGRLAEASAARPSPVRSY